MTNAKEHTDTAARRCNPVWCFSDTVGAVERSDGCPNTVIILTDEALYHTGYNAGRAMGTDKGPPPEPVLRCLLECNPEFLHAKGLKLTRIPLADMRKISAIPAKRWIEVEYCGKWGANRLAFATPDLEVYAEVFEAVRQARAPQAPVDVLKVRLSEMPVTPEENVVVFCVFATEMLLALGAMGGRLTEVPMWFAPFYQLMRFVGPGVCGSLMVVVAVLGAAVGVLHFSRRPDKQVVRFPPQS